MSENTEKEYRRVSIQLTGYITVPAETDEEALEMASNMPKNQWDWEPMTKDLVLESGEVVEICGPDEP